MGRRSSKTRVSGWPEIDFQSAWNVAPATDSGTTAVQRAPASVDEDTKVLHLSHQARHAKSVQQRLCACRLLVAKCLDSDRYPLLEQQRALWNEHCGSTDLDPRDSCSGPLPAQDQMDACRERYEKALKRIDLSLQSFMQAGVREGQRIAWQEMGEHYQHSLQWREAVTCLERALDCCSTRKQESTTRWMLDRARMYGDVQPELVQTGYWLCIRSGQLHGERPLTTDVFLEPHDVALYATLGAVIADSWDEAGLLRAAGPSARAYRIAAALVERDFSRLVSELHAIDWSLDPLLWRLPGLGAALRGALYRSLVRPYAVLSTRSVPQELRPAELSGEWLELPQQ